MGDEECSFPLALQSIFDADPETWWSAQEDHDSSARPLARFPLADISHVSVRIPDKEVRKTIDGENWRGQVCCVFLADSQSGLVLRKPNIITATAWVKDL